MQANLETMKKYPYTVYMISGTQAEKRPLNKIYMIKMEDMLQTKNDDESIDEGGFGSDEEDNEKNDNEKEPNLKMEEISVKFSINRIRSMLYSPICAVWSDDSQVLLYNLQELFDNTNLKNSQKKYHASYSKCFIQNFQHEKEGFALA